MEKSKLQIKLESGGWIYLFNIKNDRLNPDITRDGEFPYRDIMVTPIIIDPTEFEKRNIGNRLHKLKEYNPTIIRVTDAYDLEGKPLHDMRSIYVS